MPPKRFIALLVFIVPGSLLADEPNFVSIEPGLDYAHWVTPEPQSIHILRIDRSKPWNWTTAHGQGRVLSLAPLSKIVKQVESREKARVVAAINGDFYALAKGDFQGDPHGLQIVNGEVTSAPGVKACFWIDAYGALRLGKVQSKFRAIFADKTANLPFGLNERRPDDGCTLFTPSLVHTPGEGQATNLSTRTKGGRELLLEPMDPSIWLPFAIGKKYRGRVKAIHDGGSAPISQSTVVLSIGPKVKVASELPIVTELTLSFETAPDLTGVRTAIGGGPRLLRKGEVEPQAGGPRHPRSLIGWNDKSTFLIVVQGRRLTARGMTMRELAELAKQLGCTEAINLDGGGSSTLWGDNRILNSPTDGSPRGIANALLLIDRTGK